MFIKQVDYEKTGTTAVIKLNRPELDNAISINMMEEVSSICENISIDEEIRAVIVTGSGEKVFSTGADLAEFANLYSGSSLAEMTS